MAAALPATIPLWDESCPFSKMKMVYPDGHSKDSPPIPCIVTFLGGAYRLRGGTTGWEEIPKLRQVVMAEVPS